MDNDDRISHLNNSLSYKPMNIQNTSYQPISTLKNKQDSNFLNLLNKNPRKSIIPLSHLLTKSYKIFGIDNESDNSLNKNYSLVETVDENSFDIFILQNFTPFSGEQDVNQWLSETKRKFNRLLIPRNLRFTAIPLLVEGPAKKVYILNRRNIQSYEDFYEILLLHFDKTVIPSTLISQQDSVFSQSNLFHHVKSSEDETLQTMMLFETINVSEKPSTHHSTVLVDSGAATSSGEIPVSQSTVTNDNINNNLNLDETTNIFPTVLLQTLAKDPNTLKDNNSDIQKLVPGTAYHSDMTYVPHFNRLDSIPYLLRLDMTQWYKHNKIMPTSWDVFVYKKRKKAKRLSTNVYGKNSYAEGLSIRRY
ncbi:unnamed protein product [Rotaria sp. Silwood1]|nr:unnamed protein product [Rotaria sp. Silwood1]CAF1690233.1 unnamed protein product [Rotaria sp. Silwood1]